MPCNRPLAAWRARRPNEKTGRTPATFTFAEADTSAKLELPCGRCMGCRLDRARVWATRLMHEAKMHKHNYFVTLTYDDENLPHIPGPGLNGPFREPTLRPEDFVLFMKRLRHKHPGVRFYQCGEYGDDTLRPHHHAILFNCQFTDLKSLSSRARGARALYWSKELEDTWQQGMCSVGEVTFQTAAYVAKYVTKKITGERAEAHYYGRLPEYSTMSRRPGIARAYWDTYKGDIFPADEVIVNGHPQRPPRYYELRLEKEDSDARAELDAARALRPQRQLTARNREAREATLVARTNLKRDQL